MKLKLRRGEGEEGVTRGANELGRVYACFINSIIPFGSMVFGVKMDKSVWILILYTV